MIVIVPGCRAEIRDLPLAVRDDLADLLARLDLGHRLSMPVSRPMPSIGRGVHELRLRDRGGAYRIVYALVLQGTVHVLHAFKKTSQATPKRALELARARLKEVVSR